jgi:predicted N-formylglutamate amidohydrolase
MAITYILTCEHAGNDIPAEYRHLFEGKEETLYTHKAMDFGALRLAKHLASELKLPLFYTTTSRLLVESNRSLDSEELFSKYSQDLPENAKQEVLESYYFPHRNEVESKIAAAIREGKQVIHLAIHTFTPALDGEIRPAEIGILFDPKRPAEKELALNLKEALLEQNPERKVLFNSPYPGTADGFPTYLRKIFDKEVYAGFEMEVNQKFFLNGEPEVWENLQKEIAGALKKVIFTK